MTGCHHLSGSAELTRGHKWDRVGDVLDLLAEEASLPDVLTACAAVVPSHLGSAAVVALLDEDPIIGAVPDAPGNRLAVDDRWWRDTIADGLARIPLAFDRLPADLAQSPRAEGFEEACVWPVSVGNIGGCLVLWLPSSTHAGSAVADSDVRQTLRLVRLAFHDHALRLRASTDPLTGVANRSVLAQHLDTSPGTITVVVIDLDHFKPVNDNYGHHTGDAVLRIVAQRLRNAVRESDLVVRLGGDEFAVLLADTDNAHGIAERITTSIEAPIRLNAATISISASIGLATGPAADVLRHADQALYRHKARGWKP